MTCEELRDDYELYALGVAEEPVRSEIRDHLAAGCPNCTPGVHRARTLSAFIGGSVELASPRKELRRRILASAGVEQRSFGWAPWLGFATALSLTAAIYFYGRERSMVLEIVRLKDSARQQTVELSRLNEAMAILNRPDTKQVVFGGEKPAPPRGRVFVNRERGVLLIASNLPPAPAGKAYEMWVIPKGGKPAPAGVFQSGGDNTAVHVLRGPVDPNTAVVAVTVEPEGGSQTPTMPIVFAAEVAGL